MALNIAVYSLMNDMKRALRRGVTPDDVDAILRKGTKLGLTPREISLATRRAGAPVSTRDITTMLGERNLSVNVVDNPNVRTTDQSNLTLNPQTKTTDISAGSGYGEIDGEIVVTAKKGGGINRDDISIFQNAGNGNLFPGAGEATGFRDPVQDLKDATVSLSNTEIEALKDARVKIDKDLAAGKIDREQHKAAILKVLKDFGIPHDPSTFDPSKNADVAGLVNRRIVGYDPNAAGGNSSGGMTPPITDLPGAGEGEVGDGSDGSDAGGSDTGTDTNTGSSSEDTGTPTDTPSPFDQEHPWEFDATTGTMTDVVTGNVVEIPADKRGLFKDGERYSAGGDKIFDVQGTQVAGGSSDIDAEGNISNVVIWGAEGPPGAFDNDGDIFGTGDSNVNNGSNSGSSDSGDGSGTGTGGNTGSDGGAGGGTPGGGSNGGDAGGNDDNDDGDDGTGDGDGSGSGSGSFFDIAVNNISTPITDGMFADFVPRFSRQINRNLLDPIFRGRG